MMRFDSILHPKPELASLDTGLRYTDILFGFVIREIFLRMQYWQNLERHARLYLGVCLALVLGSWIGYRRSLNRSAYEVKFFNLPFFRFLLDQAMLILYFQVVTSSEVDLTKPWTDPSANANLVTDPAALANRALGLLSLVFLLYWLWDILGMWMAVAKMRVRLEEMDAQGRKQFQNQPRYPKSRLDKIGFIITTICFLLLLVLWSSNRLSSSLAPDVTFAIVIILLLLYRFAKEVRSTCRQS